LNTALPQHPTDPPLAEQPPPRRVVLVTGLSGAGRSSMLHMLEDLGYEAVDNPPLKLMEELVTRGDKPAAVGIDTRSRGFDVDFVMTTLTSLRLNPALRPELVFATATEDVLIRRYTETRRRHPLAPEGRVVDGIHAETELLAPLKEAADLVLDTTNLPIAALRGMIEEKFGLASFTAGMTLSLTSFAYPKGLPRDADLVFDMRFLRNPHYDPILRGKTGLDPDVAAYVEADPDFDAYLSKITDLLRLLLPRFVSEGKKYANIAIGCTGGRHRSVHVVQRLAAWLETFCPKAAGGAVVPSGTIACGPAWRVMVNHRELGHRELGHRGPVQRGLGPPAAGRAEQGRGEAVIRDATGTLIQALPAGRAGDVPSGGLADPLGAAVDDRATNAGRVMPAQAQEA
jgi:UPF0042 nucleotide-binding protein